MTTEKQEKIQRLLDDLKEEIFVELDRRVRTTEQELSGQISEAVETRIEESVQEKVEKTLIEHLNPWRKQVYKKFQGELQDFQSKFSYYKFPYAATVIVGFMLFWYGMWQILPQVPYINQNGFLAMAVGLGLLFLSGAAYKKLVG